MVFGPLGKPRGESRPRSPGTAASIRTATAEGVKQAADRGLFKTFCPLAVEESVRRLQAIL